MRVEHGSRTAPADNFYVQGRLGRRSSRSAIHNRAALVDFQDVERRQLSLPGAAGCNRHAERFAADNSAEVSTRAEDPTALVESAAGVGQLLRELGECQSGTQRTMRSRRALATASDLECTCSFS